MICPKELLRSTPYRSKEFYEKELEIMTTKRNFWRSVTIGIVCGYLVRVILF